jgi:hypothetical protein
MQSTAAVRTQNPKNPQLVSDSNTNSVISVGKAHNLDFIFLIGPNHLNVDHQITGDLNHVSIILKILGSHFTTS